MAVRRAPVAQAPHVRHVQAKEYAGVWFPGQCRILEVPATVDPIDPPLWPPKSLPGVKICGLCTACLR